jgi:hypothetical protein
MTTQFMSNAPLLGHISGFGPVFEGDTYCIKHHELLTIGLELDENGDLMNTCPFCEWGDPAL